MTTFASPRFMVSETPLRTSTPPYFLWMSVASSRTLNGYPFVQIRVRRVHLSSRYIMWLPR